MINDDWALGAHGALIMGPKGALIIITLKMRSHGALIMGPKGALIIDL